MQIKRVSSLGPWPIITVIASLITAFLIWWIYFKTTGVTTSGWVHVLPAVNASLNSITCLLLVGGYVAIKKSRKGLHISLMLAAVVTSAFFLISYLTYHHYAGDTKFPAYGLIRPVYFSILISHIILSIVQLPCILATLYFAFTNQFDSHKKIAKITFPIWLYVSVTGVIIFFILNHYTKSI